MEFQLSYFKSWKMILWKCCTQYASKFGKLSSGHRTGRLVFIPIPKKGNTKECSNYRTIELISHAAKWCSKFSKLGFNSMWTVNFQIFKLVLEKAEEPEIKWMNHWIIEKAREFQKNIFFCFINYAKAVVWITINWKILQQMGIPDHLTCLLRNLYAGQEVTVRTGHGTID